MFFSFRLKCALCSISSGDAECQMRRMCVHVRMRMRVHECLWFFLTLFYMSTHHSHVTRSLICFNLSNLTLEQTSCKNKLNFLHYSHIHLTRLKSLAEPLNQLNARAVWLAGRQTKSGRSRERVKKSVNRMWYVWSCCSISFLLLLLLLLFFSIARPS